MQPSANQSPRVPIGVTIFTAGYVLVGGVAALALRDTEFIFYVVVLLLLAGVVAAVHWRIQLVTASLWALSAWGAAHLAGGLISLPAEWPASGDTPVLYNLWLVPGWLRYD